jgi:transposase-like protein
MGYVPVQSSYCRSTGVIKAGKQADGTQRYRCQNGQCERRIFLLHYQDRGRIPEIRRHVVGMAINGSGIRDTARVLRISPTTVIAVFKKRPGASPRQPQRWSHLLVSAASVSASNGVAQSSWMRCGVSLGPKRPSGGCGMHLIIIREECSRMSSVPGGMRSS